MTFYLASILVECSENDFKLLSGDGKVVNSVEGIFTATELTCTLVVGDIQQLSILDSFFEGFKGICELTVVFSVDKDVSEDFMLSLRVHDIAHHAEKLEVFFVHILLNRLASSFLTVFLKHHIWTDYHNWDSDTAHDTIPCDSVLFVVTHEVSAKGVSKWDLDVELVHLHRIEVIIIKGCVLNEPIASFLVKIVPLRVTKRLIEVVSVKNDSGGNKVAVVWLHVGEKRLVEQVLVLSHHVNEEGARRTEELDIVFLHLFNGIELSVNVVIIHVCHLFVAVVAKC